TMYTVHKQDHRRQRLSDPADPSGAGRGARGRRQRAGRKDRHDRTRHRRPAPGGRGARDRREHGPVAPLWLVRRGAGASVGGDQRHRRHRPDQAGRAGRTEDAEDLRRLSHQWRGAGLSAVEPEGSGLGRAGVRGTGRLEREHGGRADLQGPERPCAEICAADRGTDRGAEAQGGQAALQRRGGPGDQGSGDADPVFGPDPVRQRSHAGGARHQAAGGDAESPGHQDGRRAAGDCGGRTGHGAGRGSANQGWADGAGSGRAGAGLPRESGAGGVRAAPSPATEKGDG
uniref:Transcription termination factor Rho n=1 Tax=Parastrongyloides trichosuri TaxID=131310 RepID=A0A0N4ZJH7_PARTI